MQPKLPRGTLERLWSDPANWRGYTCYSCKEDPRLIVPKKNRWAGWTLNFAHGRATLLLLLPLSLVIATVLLVSQTGKTAGIVAAVVILVIMFLVGRWQASTDRFEE